MGASPTFKVYSEDGEYRASCWNLLDAAILVATWRGGSVRSGHRVKDTLWHEGHEAFEASESYDRAGMVMQARLREQVAAESTPIGDQGLRVTRRGTFYLEDYEDKEEDANG